MELSGSAYLYTLATVSIAFVGFSALLLIFRQARAEATTRLTALLFTTGIAFVLAFGIAVGERPRKDR